MLNKQQIEYVKSRVNEISMCINGRLSTIKNTKVQELKDSVKELSFEEAKKMLKSGKFELVDNSSSCYEIETYYPNKHEKVGCYKIWLKIESEDISKVSKKMVALNEGLGERTAEVERYAKRLIDEVVLEIIPVTDLPMKLKEFNEMEF